MNGEVCSLTEEETYSLIFSSLKHPIRRKILRMLRDSELTFSQILEILSIDSGHLSYHLENLGDLVTHSSDGKYKLSSFGMAAVKLMSGVEEHNVSIASKSKSKVDATVKIFSTVLAVMLLLVSVYSLNLTTYTYGGFASAPGVIAMNSTVCILDFGKPGVSLGLAANQTFVYNVTLSYEGHLTLDYGDRTETGEITIMGRGPNELHIYMFNRNIRMDEWKTPCLKFDFEYNTTLHIVLTVRDPSANRILWEPLGGYLGDGGAHAGPICLSQLGTYQVEIKNVQADWLYGSMALKVGYKLSQRPLFYYGLAGVVAAFLYPVIVFLSWCWMKKAKLLTTA
jgi:hypothetical protein